MSNRLGLGARAGKRSNVATLGPELCMLATTGTWTSSGTAPPTSNGTGLHYLNSQNLAAAIAPITLQAGATYEVTITVANLTGGAVKPLLYASNTQVGTGTSRTANGTYVERITINGNLGSFTNRLHLQASGSGTTNVYDVTVTSVKQVFGG